MWSLYTTDGSGFVIGYDVSELSQLTGTEGSLGPVRYNDRSPAIIGPKSLASPKSNIPILLSIKSDDWSHEDEWRLIVELNKTIGTGETDQRGLPVNLVQIPNDAVVEVFYTDRTPPNVVQSVRDRLADTNNRYKTGSPRKLMLSTTSYGYEEASDDSEP